MAVYGSIAGSGLTFAGIDQGIDFTGAGDVYAPAAGVVTRVVPAASGWPGEGALLVYRITHGPAAGRHIYVAEDFAPALKVGDTVSIGDLLGRATGSGKAPGIEVGWADAGGHPVAPLDRTNPRAPTPAGRDFHRFVTGLPAAVADTLGVDGANSTVSPVGTSGCGLPAAAILGTLAACVYVVWTAWPW